MISDSENSRLFALKFAGTQATPLSIETFGRPLLEFCQLLIEFAVMFAVSHLSIYLSVSQIFVIPGPVSL